MIEVIIPDSVSTIGDNAFAICNYLESVKLSKNLTTVELGTFNNCVVLKSIHIPKNVTSISEMAFLGCKSLSSLTVEKGNSKYHDAGNCIIETATQTLILGTHTAVIPTDGSVIRIGKFAFFRMENLSSITIPEGITAIHQQAFDFCYGLETIYLPTSLTTIDSCAFSYDTKLTNIYYAGTIEQWSSRFPNDEYFLPNDLTVTIHCSDGDITNP